MRWPTYQDYLASPEWAAQREKAFKHHGRRCQMCGVTRRLEVHHIRYLPQRFWGKEKMKDLMILCRDCHQSVSDYIKAHKGEADHYHLHMWWFFSEKRKREMST
jgi:5-methylcytosine-specific restriction endonuclease McrA